jgi:hypothetical protein
VADIVSPSTCFILVKEIVFSHMKIKRISPRSLGKMMGVAYAVVGVIFGAIMSLFALVATGPEQVGMGIFMGLGAVVLLPIAYGIMGIIGGYIAAWLFNFSAGKVGGIEIETE